jgi:hypothetical protein
MFSVQHERCANALRSDDCIVTYRSWSETVSEWPLPLLQEPSQGNARMLELGLKPSWQVAQGPSRTEFQSGFGKEAKSFRIMKFIPRQSHG